MEISLDNEFLNFVVQLFQVPTDFITYVLRKY